MLQRIHDLAKGWLAYVIVALLIIPFALWGIHEYFGTGGDRVAAVVNGTEIPAQELRNAIQQQRERMRTMFGGRLPPQFVDDSLLGEAALNELIRRELIRQEADRAGYRVGDDLLVTGLQEIEVFQENGRFSPSRYEQILSMQRRSKAGFELQLREGIRLSQLEGGVSGTSFATGAAARDYQRLQGQTRDLAYLMVQPDGFADRIDPTDQEIEAHYEAHPELFQRPERARLAYVELSIADLARSVEVSEDELKSTYQEQIDRYTTLEERRASHILLSLSRDATDAEVEAAEQRAQSLLQRIRAGEEFAKLARENSQDSLSAEQGGDLGVVREGDQPPAVEQVLKGLETGQVSDPVRTEFGFHLVKLTELKPARTKDFSEVRDSIEAEYRRQQAEVVYVDYADELATISYEAADTLEPAADAIGSTVKTTDWVTRDGGDGVAADPRVRQVAFGAEVLQDGRNSDLIELSDGQALVVRILEHEPAARRPLDEVRDEVRARLIEETTRERARELGERLLGELRDGAALESVAANSATVLESLGFVARDDATAPPEILRRAFSMPRPVDGQSRFEGVTMADGAYAIVAVRAVTDGDQEADLASARAGLGADYSRREEQAFFNALRERAEVRVFRDEP